MKLKAGAVCDRGLSPRRPVNQDRFLVLPRTGLFAVFDGVGGHRAGEIASQTAADTIRQEIPMADSSAPAELVARAIESANQRIYDRARSDPSCETMATTVALAYITGNRATIAHVGDSRVYRIEDGRLHQETVDHADSDDHVINRALGVEPEVDIEIKSFSMKEGDRLLLCTDGIYRNVSEEQIVSVLTRNGDPQRAADELKRITYDRGAADNLTAIVVQLGGETKRRDLRGSRIEVALGADQEAVQEPVSRPGKLKTALLILLVVLAMSGAFYAGMLAEGRWHRERPEPATGIASVNSLISEGRDVFEQGDSQAAMAAFSAAVAREPGNSEAHYWMGRSQLELGQYEAAAKSFTRAAELAPGMLDAYLQGAASYQAAGDRTKAREMLARYGELRRLQH